MAPEIVLDVLSHNDGQMRVLDPMAGSGTTVVAARLRGYQAYGVDSDPLAVIIAAAASHDFDESTFRRDADRLMCLAKIANRTMRDADAYPLAADEETRKFIRYWFDLRSRRQLAALVIALRQGRYVSRQYLLCAFSRMIITKHGGVSLAEDISHSRPHRTRDKAPSAPFDALFASVNHIARHAQFQFGAQLPQPSVVRGDCRLLPFDDKTFNYIITSPPYLNAIDYLRGHKMSLVWFGHSIRDLRRLRSKSIGSEVSSADSGVDYAVNKMVSEPSCLPSRLRGIMRRYVRDMGCAISEMKRVAKKGACIVLVVGDCTVRGIEIRNSKAIDILCKSIGLKFTRKRLRALERHHRYLPPPATRNQRNRITDRLWDEVILEYKVV